MPATTLALYAACFPWAYDAIGTEYFDLLALPVASVAAAWGVTVGVLFAPMAAMAGYAILAKLEGVGPLDPTNIAHLILFLAIAYGFGTMFDLLRDSRAQSARAERSESSLKTLVANAPVIFFSVDASGRFVAREGRALHKLGYASGAHVGQDARAFYRREYPEAPALVENLESALRGEPSNIEVQVRGRAFEVTFVPLTSLQGECVGAVGVAVDVTERNHAEQKLRTSEARLGEIIRSARDAIITVDEQSQIVIFNAAAERMFDRSAAEMLGRPLDVLVPFGSRAEHAEHVTAFLETGRDGHEMQGLELKAVRASGEEFPIEATLSRTVVDGHMLVTVILRDVTELRAAEAELRHHALYDTLTGLPNRTLLSERIDAAIAHLRRESRAGALLLVDVADFQDTNEMFGHDFGDTVLKAVAGRLRAALGESDTLARSGGDEFAIFAAGADERGARHLADRIVASLSSPLAIDGNAIEQTVNIGIATFPRLGDDRVLLMRHAEAALTQAKRAREAYAVYSPSHDRANLDSLLLLSDLRISIENKQIDVAFQPEVDMATGAVVRAEVLARWTSPMRGPIGPDRFIPLAERSGLIGALTRCVLEKALTHVAGFRTRGIDIAIAVNLSVQDLLDRALPFTIDDLLKRYGVPASQLSIELTESVLMTEIDRAVPTLSTLRSLGIDVAIDDFGTGYSSLSYLTRLPVDRVKIDRSFVRAMNERGATAVIRAAIDLAHTLNLGAVAEGVEDRSQWQALLDLGCDSAQGYLIARPMSADQLIPWLESHAPRPRLLGPEPVLFAAGPVAALRRTTVARM